MLFNKIMLSGVEGNIDNVSPPPKCYFCNHCLNNVQSQLHQDALK